MVHKRYDEQKQSCQRIGAEFDLKYPGSINAAYTLGRFIYRRENNPDEAIPIFRRIISETTYPYWIRVSKKRLVQILMDKGEPSEKIIPLLEDLLSSAQDDGDRKRWGKVLAKVRGGK